jgi:hypothetical protein
MTRNPNSGFWALSVRRCEKIAKLENRHANSLGKRKEIFRKINFFTASERRSAAAQRGDTIADPLKIRLEVERMLNRRLLGIVDPDDPIDNPDPALLI